MTVYNRKMFRKKGGGATGIMASGPELMKRFNLGGVARQFEPNYTGAPGQVFFNQSARPFTRVSDELSRIAQQTAGIKGSFDRTVESQFVTLPTGQKIKVLDEDGRTPRSAGAFSLKNPSIARLYREQHPDGFVSKEKAFRKDIASQLDTFEDPRAPKTQTFTTGVSKNIAGNFPKVDVDTFGAIPGTSAIPEETFKDDTTVGKSFIGPEDDVKLGDQINAKNKELLEKKDEKKADLSFKPKKVTVNKKGLEVETVDDIKKDIAKKEDNKTETPGKKKAFDESTNTLKISIGSDLTTDEDQGFALKDYMKKFSDYKGREINMGDLEELAAKTSGYDPNDPDKSGEQRKDAFFMGLIRAGLAVAAGESDDMFTNLAKGLAFGVEAYAKDIDTLNKDEKENRKEYYRSLRELVKDEKSAIAAEKALAAQIDGNNARIASQIGMNNARIKAQKEIAQLKNDTELYVFAKNNQIKIAELDLKAGEINSLNEYRTAIINKDIDQFSKTHQLNLDKFDEIKKQSLQKMKEFNINSTINLLDNDSKVALQVYGGIERDSEGNITSIELNDEGQSFVKQLALLSKIKSTNTTDLMRKVTATAKSNMAGTVDLSGLSEADKLNAAMIWETQFKDIYNDTFNIVDPITKVKLAPNDASVQGIQNSIIDKFKNQISGFKNKAINLTTTK